MKCQSCGADNPDYAIYCGRCATELPSLLVGGGMCRSCGIENPEGQRYCGSCGADLSPSHPSSGTSGSLGDDWKVIPQLSESTDWWSICRLDLPPEGLSPPVFTLYFIVFSGAAMALLSLVNAAAVAVLYLSLAIAALTWGMLIWWTFAIDQ